ncbi:MAG TPA: hypothetical protein VGY97_11080 [Solirubrobacteraceae bacterium]|jgi:hypothetical protein|nr:hypothetical protein [Solirubrobacteraceae bacterium]
MAPTGYRPYAACRTEIIDLAEAGLELAGLEDLIRASAQLSEEERSALWLLAWSLRGSDAELQPALVGAGERFPRSPETLTGGGRGSPPEVPHA